MEKGLPSPPGLDRFAARSLRNLKDDVQWLEIQPPIHKTDDHVVWLRLWLLIGTIVVALIPTGQWTRSIRLVRRQWIRPWFRDRATNLASNSRERKGKIVGESAILRAHGPSQVTSTGISVEEGQVTELRRRTKTVASEAITMPTSDLADERLRARNRAVHPAGKERVEKERRRRDREESKWNKPVGIQNARLNEANQSSHFDLPTGYNKWDWNPKHEFNAGFIFSNEGDKFFDEESEDSDGAVEYYYGERRQAKQRSKLGKAAAVKQAQRRNRGITPSPWPIPRCEKRNPRKWKRGCLYSHLLTNVKLWIDLRTQYHTDG